MTTEELKKNPYVTYECKPKRNTVLYSDNMDLKLYATQKWEVRYLSYEYKHREGKNFYVTKKNNRLGLRLRLTETEFNEYFEFR